MAARFSNSNLGYYLYSVLVILVGAASLLFFWYIITGFNVGIYAENTFVGSVYIGGMTPDDAREKVEERIESWLDDETVVFELGYQGYYYEIDRELLDFDIETTLANLQDSMMNPLIVNLTDTNQDLIYFDLRAQSFMENFLPNPETTFNLDLVIEDLLEDAAQMRRYSSRQLNSYFINEEAIFETLLTRSIGLPPDIDVDHLYNKILETFEEGIIQLPPRAIVSVLDIFDETYTDKELRFISMLLLDLIQETHMTTYPYQYNYWIDSGYTIEDFPHFGSNVLIRRSQNIGFSFENNSHCSFEIHFDVIGGELVANLVGAPILNTITVSSDQIEIDYNTEIRGSDGEEKTLVLVQEGQKGIIHFVVRTIIDINGDEISQHEIIIEYYRPINEVKEYQ